MGIWFAAAVGAVLLGAQEISAVLTGTVTDAETGDPVAGAVVSLPDLQRTSVTDAFGAYHFGSVPAGPQHVEVHRVGYSARTLHALVPREGTISLHVALQPEPIALDAVEVEVRAAVPVRGLEDDAGAPYPDRELSMAAVRAHPLASEPDALQALGGGEVFLRPESPSGVHVRGGGSDQVVYLLDGIPVLSPYRVAGAFSAWNPDALYRIELLTSAPPPDAPESLSGVVAASTRAPGSSVGVQGGASTTQARIAFDGPIGGRGAGYLVSLRAGFPGYPDPEAEESYLRSEHGEWLAKVETPLFGGSLHLLGYDAGSEVDVAAAAEPEETSEPLRGRRHEFEWHSRSVGGEWERRWGRTRLRLRGWRAAGDAEALWEAGVEAAERVSSERTDEAVALTLERGEGGHRTALGLRGERIRTSYDVRSETAGAPLSLASRTDLLAAFVEHARPLGRSAELRFDLVGTGGAGDVHVSPRVLVRWRPPGPLTVSGAFARLHQYAQSLRNPESVVGSIFPAELYVGASAEGVPVATSDQGILAVEVRPAAGLRAGIQAYVRSLSDLALVAPRADDPFAQAGFVAGSGRARGVSLDASANGARYGVLASYGLQRVRLEYADSSYVPEHGATHTLDAGVVVFPTTTSSVRAGARAVFGRRSTPIAGAFEWEACNLLDRGCEFGGSPRHPAGLLGSTRLPAYLRLDLGVEKHWHVELAGRDGLLSVFASVTNLLDRRNVLAVATDPESGESTEIAMRPRSPLVLGIDWRF